MKKICVVTGTRAEYGLLKLIMKGILDDDNLKLQIIVTGAHLSPEFGHTYRLIEDDGFTIDQKIEMLISSDTPVGVTKSMGLGLIGLADALYNLSPDFVLILGDRYEMLITAIASVHAQIPIIHLHGGEITEGSLDEMMRHAITKLSFIHCVATEEYRQRVIQLGELPDHVFVVGGLGVDIIRQTSLICKNELEEKINFKFKDKNLLITFHPTNVGNISSINELNQLLKALNHYQDIGLIFTFPNADAGSRELINTVNIFVESHKNSKLYTSLGNQFYLSCMAICDATVGNSSSGLLETPTFRKGTINIGDRQNGRIQARSVINCKADEIDIRIAIEKLYSDDFQKNLEFTSNPYEREGASRTIINIIHCLNKNQSIKKNFYDLPNK